MKNLPLVIPIVNPLINWNGYLKTIHDYANRTPTRLTDAESNISEFYRFIGSLGYFSKGILPSDSVRCTPSLLKHLSFTFVIEMERSLLLKLLLETNLTVTDNAAIDKNVIYIVSGNLLSWRDAILLFTHELQPIEIRYVFDCIYLYFQQIGLQEIFYNYSRTTLSDQTFKVSR